jgi:hypothetical protein
MELQWTTEQMPLGSLVEYEKNPVQISKRDAQELARSLQKFGHIIPYTAAAPRNGGTVPILDGHQRKRVEIEILGVSPDALVDVRFPSRALTERERQEAIIRLRKNTGEFDPDALLNWFEGEDLLEWGFDEKELGKIGFEFGDTEDEHEIATDRFEEIAKKWETAPGQLWRVGDHFIYCGDSLEVESIETVLQGQEPSLVIADPPYGVSIVAANGYVGGGESSKGMIPFGGVKNRRLRGTDGASKPYGSKSERGSDGAAHVVEVGKYPVIIGDENTETAKKAVELYLQRFDNAYHIWWGANYYVEALNPSPCWLVWNKESTGNFADCELAWTNADKPAQLFTHRWNGMLRDSEHERRWHPTQKPAALASWSYGLFTDEGEVILDPFGGAGWSLLGAEKSGRKACVIEMSHEYIAVQLERMSKAFEGIEIRRVS